VSAEHFDLIVVGAGISGIGAGYFLQTLCPGKRYAILEGRHDLGGTWDLFRYPGIRSDSDMFTLGYSFRPWKEPTAFANGPAILKYLRETAREHGIDRQMRFGHRVIASSWSSEEARWTVECVTDQVGADAAAKGSARRTVHYTCNFLYLCSGYYDYEHGYKPSFPGEESFLGQIIHPQQWPKDLDYCGKRIVVIGSGATAVTLVPAMAETAAHVTMLQRSPSYIVPLPSKDRIANMLRKLLPERSAHWLISWKNVLFGIYTYRLCRKRPEAAKRLLRRLLTAELPPEFDIDKHFTPRYEPWDQRVCVAPDADLFRAIRSGRVAIVTDKIKCFTAHGILLESGQELPADIIVTATGLKLLALGGIRLSVDGAAVDPGQALSYKGLMLSDVPNFAVCTGYSNASWTLRADLSSIFVCRLLTYMDRQHYRQCMPHHDGPAEETQPLITLKAGYVKRGVDQFPKQGSKAPWILRQNYFFDLLSLHYGAVEDGALLFSNGEGKSAPKPSGTATPTVAAGKSDQSRWSWITCPYASGKRKTRRSR
jgi:cation diffusion facilitator CzcD-associated flavoprotein CzcO